MSYPGLTGTRHTRQDPGGTPPRPGAARHFAARRIPVSFPAPNPSKLK
jgi:hypothetical protein